MRKELGGVDCAFLLSQTGTVGERVGGRGAHAEEEEEEERIEVFVRGRGDKSNVSPGEGEGGWVRKEERVSMQG